MFIAHLPAGYLLTRHLQRKAGNPARGLMVAGLIASILPDSDLFYFYLIDHRSMPHHHYLTHWPLTWITLALLMWGVLHLIGKPRAIPYVGMMLANTLLHILMDSVMATTYWFEPFFDTGVNLLHISSRYHWWVFNYVLHWTFMLEIFIVLIALHSWIAHAEEHPDRR